MNKHEPMSELDDHIEQIAHDTIGAAIEVHRNLGPGFLESIYENAMAVELQRRQIPHDTQHHIQVQYKNTDVGSGRLDLLIDDSLVVELKAVDTLAPIHDAQILSYLKALNHPLGLLINFNTTRLKDGGIKRVIAENLISD